MIPILYDTNETSFDSNGLGRLRDAISVKVFEERNGLYEADFEYPITGANYEKIKVGRIIGVTHDESGDIQPFDIVSYSRPINGVVTFHCTHISYRQSYMTATGSNINSLADAFTLLGTAEPNNPFTYDTDKTSSGYMSAADGKPKSVRSLLGGTEGSILDTYGGEFEWDKWTVRLHSNRGRLRDFTVRYGVNMTDYKEDLNVQGSYSSCIPYWTNGTNTVVGDRQDSGNPTVTGRGECVPLDVSDKFQNQPTKAEVEAMGLSLMQSRDTNLPVQTIHAEFIRLQDSPEYAGLERLLQCKLCDTIKVVFPDYNATGTFKIVKTTWNVLKDRYESMELGDLSMSLSEALGVNNSQSYSGSGSSTEDDFVVEVGSNTNGSYRKWDSGILECWIKTSQNVALNNSYGAVYLGNWTWTFPVAFNADPTIVCTEFRWGTGGSWGEIASSSTTSAVLRGIDAVSRASGSCNISAYAIGKWK